jgi:hypothetical protein
VATKQSSVLIFDKAFSRWLLDCFVAYAPRNDDAQALPLEPPRSSSSLRVATKQSSILFLDEAFPRWLLDCFVASLLAMTAPRHYP